MLIKFSYLDAIFGDSYPNSPNKRSIFESGTENVMIISYHVSMICRVLVSFYPPAGMFQKIICG